MKTYNFAEQLSKGDEGEALIDAVLQLYLPSWTFLKAKMPEQRRGIDRHVMTGNRNQYDLEYKTDYKAAQTGNIFLELEVDGADGWFWKTESDYIVWYLPGLEKILVVRTIDMKVEATNEGWSSVYRKLVVKNETYEAKGIAVPLAVIEDLAAAVFDVPRRG